MSEIPRYHGTLQRYFSNPGPTPLTGSGGVSSEAGPWVKAADVDAEIARLIEQIEIKEESAIALAECGREWAKRAEAAEQRVAALTVALQVGISELNDAVDLLSGNFLVSSKLDVLKQMEAALRAAEEPAT